MSIQIEHIAAPTPTGGGHFSLQCIYDSKTFVVVQIDWTTVEGVDGFGFEIADREALESVFLHGSHAAVFQDLIQRWKIKPEDQDAVERALAAFCAYGRVPVLEQ